MSELTPLEQAQLDKMKAETVRIELETRLYPFVVVAGLFAAAAAIGKLFLS